MYWRIKESLEAAAALSVGCIATNFPSYIPERMAEMNAYLKEAKECLRYL